MTKVSVVHDILNSPDKMYSINPGMTAKEALEFGFSYVETQDHMVRYIAIGPDMLNKIFKEIDEAKKDPAGEKMGSLWTADV